MGNCNSRKVSLPSKKKVNEHQATEVQSAREYSSSSIIKKQCGTARRSDISETPETNPIKDRFLKTEGN